MAATTLTDSMKYLERVYDLWHKHFKYPVNGNQKDARGAIFLLGLYHITYDRFRRPRGDATHLVGLRLSVSRTFLHWRTARGTRCTIFRRRSLESTISPSYLRMISHLNIHLHSKIRNLHILDAIAEESSLTIKNKKISWPPYHIDTSVAVKWRAGSDCILVCSLFRSAVSQSLHGTPFSILHEILMVSNMHFSTQALSPISNHGRVLRYRCCFYQRTHSFPTRWYETNGFEGYIEIMATIPWKQRNTETQEPPRVFGVNTKQLKDSVLTIKP